MRRHAMVALLFVLAASLAAATDDETAIRATFERYRQALLAGDGAAAWACVDARTRQYYDDLVRHALTSSRAELDKLEPGYRFMVLRIRLEANRSTLGMMKGRDAFLLAVERGMISRSSVEAISELAQIRSDGRLAGASLPADPETPVFAFVREDREWKLALWQTFDMLEDAFAEMIKQSGHSENEFLKALLAKVTTVKVDDRVFEGPLP